MLWIQTFKTRVASLKQQKNSSTVLAGALKVPFTSSPTSTMDTRTFELNSYFFRDISCFEDVSSWLHSNGLLIGDICMIIAGVLLLIIIFTCCLCLHPEKKLQAGNFYQKMAYYD
jgi:hypothetical protein